MKNILRKAGIVLLMAFSQVASAQDYPAAKPINLVIGFGAGGPTDMVGRYLARELEKELGQKVVVENRPGANGLVALQYVKRAKPDGYTMLLGSSGSLAIEPAIKKKVDYDIFKDFVPAAPLAKYPYLLVVAKESPFKTVNDLIQQAKADGSSLSFASAGNGADNQLAGEWFSNAVGAKMLHVPYSGGDGPAMMDLVAGRVDFAFISAVAALPQIEGEKIRALAVASEKPAEFAPGVPTIIKSAGIPDFVVGPWNGVLVPAGTSPAIVERLNAAVSKVMSTEDARVTLLQLGQYPFIGSSEEFSAFIKAQQQHWNDVVSSAGIAKID